MSIAILLTAAALTYPIVDTGQALCHDDRNAIEFPTVGNPYHGQDAQYSANPPSYKINGDGYIPEDEAPTGPPPNRILEEN
jgi:hypothetical protein